MNAGNQTGILQPYSVVMDLEEGIMRDPARRTVRKTSDMRGYYADENALEELITEQSDPLHYHVLERPVPEERGHLMHCISILQPGTVGDEYFMTRGHYHTLVDTAEIYLCLRGEGYMLMKTSDGRCASEHMERGRMVYVPPFWAHRSVNTGQEPLVSFCVYPADAGHNYGDIEREGFPRRVMERDGNVVIEKQ